MKGMMKRRNGTKDNKNRKNKRSDKNKMKDEMDNKG